MIIDLRGNPGGYLEVAVDMASWFLPVGKSVVITDYSGKQPEDIARSRGYDVFTDNLKLAILMDGGSASASEIFAGALKDHGKATLIGVKSFGKGSVQQLFNVTNDSSLKITIARWLTPNGISISHQGLEPDIKVEFSKEDLEAKRDTQLERAAEFLKTGK
jgi:carboxyl-terminal processing protease